MDPTSFVRTCDVVQQSMQRAAGADTPAGRSVHPYIRIEESGRVREAQKEQASSLKEIAAAIDKLISEDRNKLGNGELHTISALLKAIQDRISVKKRESNWSSIRDIFYKIFFFMKSPEACIKNEKEKIDSLIKAHEAEEKAKMDSIVASRKAARARQEQARKLQKANRTFIEEYNKTLRANILYPQSILGGNTFLELTERLDGVVTYLTDTHHHKPNSPLRLHLTSLQKQWVKSINDTLPGKDFEIVPSRASCELLDKFVAENR